MSLEAHGLTVRKNHRNLLQEVTFRLSPGTFTAMLGPNGAGKTTLFRLLSGEEQATGGSIRIGGHDLSTIPARQLATFRAIMPQESHLAFPFTVREVVQLGRLPHDDDPVRAERICQQALADMEMDAMADRIFPTLSGGEKQRVHLARVLAQVATPSQAPLLFLDEPISHLDPAHRFMALEAARGVARRGGIVLCSLHDLNLVSRYADRLLALRDGRLLACGAVDEVLTEELLERLFSVGSQTAFLPDGVSKILHLFPSVRSAKKMPAPSEERLDNTPS